MIGVGLALQPEQAFLDLLEPVIRDVDYYEVAPETLWWADAQGGLHENGYFGRFAQLLAATGKPFVAHGVGLSLGTADHDDGARRRRWLDRVARDHAVFGFEWYTEHLGATSMDGKALALPLPLPMTEHVARVVRGRLRSMQRVVDVVGVENTAAYFLLGDPLDEPAFLRRILRRRGHVLLLDLHNLYTMALNFGFDPQAYLRKLELDRVIEIHVSGGVDADPRWTKSGRVMRLDSHDAPVPEPVWALLDWVLPRCSRLRGVTLERMEGTVGQAEVPLIAGEIARIRAAVCRRFGAAAAPLRLVACD